MRSDEDEKMVFIPILWIFRNRASGNEVIVAAIAPPITIMTDGAFI